MNPSVSITVTPNTPRRFTKVTRMFARDDTAYTQPYGSSGEQFSHNTPYPEGKPIP